jgi:putative membrane protein
MSAARLGSREACGYVAASHAGAADREESRRAVVASRDAAVSVPGLLDGQHRRSVPLIFQGRMGWRSAVGRSRDEGTGKPTNKRTGEENMVRRAWLMVGLALGLWPSVAAAQGRPYDWGGGMHPMWGLWGVWGLGMMVMMLVFWALVIAGIVLAIRWLVSQGRPGHQSDTALDILRQRYARGEINKEEFEAKRRDLT